MRRIIMISQLAFLLLMSASHSATAFNCTNAGSSISDQWTINTTIAGTFLAAIQVVGSCVTFIADGIYYKKTHSDKNKKLDKQLNELRINDDKSIRDEPKIALKIFNEMAKYIKERGENIKNDQELVELIKDVKDLINIISEDQELPWIVDRIRE